MDINPQGSSVHGIIQASILEWTVIPFSRGSFQPKDQTQVSCIADRFFTIWATREIHDKEDYKDSPSSSRGIYRHLQRLLVEHIQHFVILTLLIFHNMLFLKLFFFLKLFKGMTEDEMAGWRHWLDGHGFGWTPGVDGGQGGLVCCNSWGRRVGHD